jgi:membrane-associated progesterone receptor component
MLSCTHKQYFAIIVVIVLGYTYTSGSMVGDDKFKAAEPEEEEEPDPPRNFTLKQLAFFDGQKDAKSLVTDDNDFKPVYLSLNTTVFDCTDGRNFYGPGGPYELFSGHECGVALAKMSFDDTHLDDLDGISTLKFTEKNDLDGWIEKFTYYRNYPVKGKLVPEATLPAADKVWTKLELEKYNGVVAEGEEPPEGYATAPIYIGAGGKVYDVSFGGSSFYGPGGPYAKFSGRDASRALAKMSLDVKDLDNTDTSDLTDKEKKILSDWIKTFEEKKCYPVVGLLQT